MNGEHRRNRFQLDKHELSNDQVQSTFAKETLFIKDGNDALLFEKNRSQSDH